MFILLGKIGITAGNCVSFYFVLKLVTKEQVGSLIGPMAVVGAISFITASLFLGLFDTTVMSLMTCLAVDMDINDGYPAFGPPTFHEGISNIKVNQAKVMDEGAYMMM